MRFFAFLFHSSVPKSLSSSPVESGDVKGIGAPPKRVENGCIYIQTLLDTVYTALFIPPLV